MKENVKVTSLKEVADNFVSRWIQGHVAALKEFSDPEEEQQNEAE